MRNVTIYLVNKDFLDTNITLLLTIHLNYNTNTIKNFFLIKSPIKNKKYHKEEITLINITRINDDTVKVELSIKKVLTVEELMFLVDTIKQEVKKTEKIILDGSNPLNEAFIAAQLDMEGYHQLYKEYGGRLISYSDYIMTSIPSQIKNKVPSNKISQPSQLTSPNYNPELERSLNEAIQISRKENIPLFSIVPIELFTFPEIVPYNVSSLTEKEKNMIEHIRRKLLLFKRNPFGTFKINGSEFEKYNMYFTDAFALLLEQNGYSFSIKNNKLVAFSGKAGKSVAIVNSATFTNYDIGTVFTEESPSILAIFFDKTEEFISVNMQPQLDLYSIYATAFRMVYNKKISSDNLLPAFYSIFSEIINPQKSKRIEDPLFVEIEYYMGNFKSFSVNSSVDLEIKKTLKEMELLDDGLTPWPMGDLLETVGARTEIAYILACTTGQNINSIDFLIDMFVNRSFAMKQQISQQVIDYPSFLSSDEKTLYEEGNIILNTLEQSLNYDTSFNPYPLSSISKDEQAIVKSIKIAIDDFLSSTRII